VIIRGVLKEELKNSLDIKRAYERELKKLPKGALIKKIIKGHEYYYLEVREGKKIKFIYKGKLSKEEIEEFNQIKKYREKYKRLLSEANDQIKFIRRALGGKRAKEAV